MLPEISQKTLAIGIAVLLILHLAIAAPMALSLNVWMDEASTLYATQNGFWVAFQTATAEQKQAPLYFWIMSVWRLADDSIFFARLFSILCSLGAIVVFARFVRRFFSPLGALALSAFFALHPFLIWASLEIRVYSMVILLSVILISLFFDAFFDDTDVNDRRQWLFLAVVIVSLYSNYYLGFMIAGLFFVLILTGKGRPAIRYAALMVLAFAAFLPLVLITVTELGSRSDGFVVQVSLLECIRVVWHHFLTFLLPTEIFPPPDQTSVSFARLWIARFGLAVLGFLAIRSLRDITVATLGLCILTLIVATFIALAGLLVGPLLIASRHASVMFAVTILGCAFLIKDISAAWSREVRSLTFAVGVLFVIVLFFYSITNIYPEHVKRGDWAQVSAFIEENESNGQPIMVFLTYEALSPRYHYKGINHILPDERFFDFISGAGMSSQESLDNEIDFVISEIPKDAERIWFALGDVCSRKDICTHLQTYLDENYTVEIEKKFYSQKLYLLKKNPR